LLTVNVPIGLQLPGNPQGISFKGSHLAVESGKTVALVGGEISLDSSQIVAPGGKVELGGLAEAGIVGLNLADNNLSLNFFDDLTKADVFLNNAAKVKVQKGNSGSISINAQNLELKKQSSLEAGIAKNASSVESQAGDINIDTTEKITLDEASSIANIIRIGGKGRGGNIQISTGSIFLINGGSIDASTYGEGDSGSININARDTISLTGTTDCDVCSAILNNVGEFVSTPQTAEGNSGGINVDTGSLYITNEAYIDSSVYGQGHSGNINVNASNTIFITGDPNNNNNFASNIFSNVGDPDIPTAKGNSGDINITTNSLFLDNNATLNTVTFAKGDAGNINISVTQDSFKIIRGAAITSATVGKGNAGNINISVAKTLLIDRVLTDGFPSLISSTVGGVFPDIFEGRGEGGDINIKAGSVTISNGAWIAAASVLGEGNAGKISIETDSLTLNNRALIANATGAIGNAGEIEINAKSIYISGQISGNMPLSKALRSQFRIDNRGISSGLYTNTEKEAKGQGGNITINTDRLQLTDGGLINAQTLNKYAGGNVSINAKIFEATRGGQVVTSTRNVGNAGSIAIQATESILLFGSDPRLLDRQDEFGKETIRNIGDSSGLFASTSGTNRQSCGDR
jgi:large exoprotein involved in heme utilization and adhesion